MGVHRGFKNISLPLDFVLVGFYIISMGAGVCFSKMPVESKKHLRNGTGAEAQKAGQGICTACVLERYMIKNFTSGIPRLLLFECTPQMI